MDIRKRKIGFYYLTLRTELNNLSIHDETKRILSFIMAQSKKAKKKDLSTDKFCFLESCNLNRNGDLQELVFKTATHNYRAPLVDRETVTERDNPKTLKEGEIQKTHFLIKYKDGDAILLGEKYRGALSLAQLIYYLNVFKDFYEKTKGIKLNYDFAFEIIAKDNISEELEKLNRVLSACVYVDKQLLGGEALNFSSRIQSVQESIVIDIRASRFQSIKETAKDILAKFNGGERIVHKVRIKGKNHADNDITIDTEFIEKREYVEAQLNEETGEVNSQYLLFQLNEIANTL